MFDRSSTVQRNVANCTNKLKDDGRSAHQITTGTTTVNIFAVVSHTWRGVFQRCGIFIPLSLTGDVLMSLVRLITNSNKSRGKLAAFMDSIRDG